MTAPEPKASLRDRAVSELKEMVIITLYLFVVIAAMNVMKTAVLEEHGIDFTYLGTGLVKALVLAKFILIGKAFKVGEHKKTGPLIWPILHKVFAFLVLLVALTVVEEILVGLFHHHSVAESLGDLFGQKLAETLAGILLLLLVLIPYFAFEVLAEALGEQRLVKMLFVDRDAR